MSPLAPEWQNEESVCLRIAEKQLVNLRVAGGEACRLMDGRRRSL